MEQCELSDEAYVGQGQAVAYDEPSTGRKRGVDPGHVYRECFAGSMINLLGQRSAAQREQIDL